MRARPIAHSHRSSSVTTRTNSPSQDPTRDVLLTWGRLRIGYRCLRDAVFGVLRGSECVRDHRVTWNGRRERLDSD